MWEVPLWVLAAKGLYSMDYASDGAFSVYDVLKVSGLKWLGSAAGEGWARA